MTSTKDHWDNIFSKTDDTILGWYEKDNSRTFKLLSEVSEMKKATVFLPGAGSSILIEDLMPRVRNCIRSGE